MKQAVDRRKSCYKELTVKRNCERFEARLEPPLLLDRPLRLFPLVSPVPCGLPRRSQGVTSSTLDRIRPKDLKLLNCISKFFDRDFKVDEKPVWEGLSVRSNRIIASSASAERIGARRC